MNRHMQQMDNMMNQIMGDPFNGMLNPMMGNRNQMLTNGNHFDNSANMMMSPFGGGMMGGGLMGGGMLGGFMQQMVF